MINLRCCNVKFVHEPIGKINKYFKSSQKAVEHSIIDVGVGGLRVSKQRADRDRQLWIEDTENRALYQPSLRLCE